MNWTEITIKVPLSYCDTAAAIANMAVPYGIYIEDYSDLEEKAVEIAHIDLIDEDLIARDRENAIIHLYISECDNAAEALAFLKERYTAEKIPFSVDAIGVNDADWSENWKKYFHAMEIGERLAVVPSWETYDNAQNRLLLHIDPGAAFGTGTHATTSLCLAMLEKTVKKGDAVLDIGCGSGILAIAAVLLGAKSALGVDIDAQSVKTARENAAINGLEGKTAFIVGDLADKVTGKYDVICANIVADVIIKLLATVQDYMKEDTLLLCSGIIDSREQDVIAAAEQYGFSVSEIQHRENWCAMALKKGSV